LAVFPSFVYLTLPETSFIMRYNRFLITVLLAAIVTTATAQSGADSIITLDVVEISEKAIKPLHPLTTLEMITVDRSAVVDLGEMLRSQPNISGIRRGGYAIDPVVRGFRFSQINIFLDEGVHIEGGCPNRMDPVLAHIKSEDIQRLEVAHGPYLLKYGPTLGSSIRVVSKPETPYGKKTPHLTSITSFDANRNGFRQHLALQESGKNSFYRLSGGYLNYGDYTDGNGNKWNTGFKKYSVSADAGYRLPKSQEIDFAYKGSFARDVMFPALPMDETADNTHIFSANYTKRNPSNPEEQLKISGYFSSVYHEMDNSRRPQYSQIVPPWQGLMQAVAKVDTRSAGTRLVATRQFHSFKLEGGFDVDYTMKDGNRYVKMIMTMDGEEYVTERVANLWNDAQSLRSGLYAGLNRHTDIFDFSITFRTDINHSTSGDSLFIENNGRIYYDAKPSTHFFWSLAGNARYNISESLNVAVGIGRGVRPPDLSERYIQFLATGFDRYDYLGNPNLKPEVNYQADLMAEYTGSGFQAYANFFRADIQNFITGSFLPPSVARPQSMGAPGVKQFQNIERAVFYGFETGVSWQPLSGLHTSVSAGYTYAYFPEIEKIILQNNQATGTEILNNDPVPEIPALESQFKLAYKMLQNRLEPSLEIRAVAGQNMVSDASYETATPGFVLAGMALAWQPVQQLRLTAGVSNLFNKAYYEHLNRRIIGSGNNFYEPGRSIYLNLKIVI
jgi:iron complex outermembrane recepter protein